MRIRGGSCEVRAASHGEPVTPTIKPQEVQGHRETATKLAVATATNLTLMRTMCCNPGSLVKSHQEPLPRCSCSTQGGPGLPVSSGARLRAHGVRRFAGGMWPATAVCEKRNPQLLAVRPTRPYFSHRFPTGGPGMARSPRVRCAPDLPQPGSRMMTDDKGQHHGGLARATNSRGVHVSLHGLR